MLSISCVSSIVSVVSKYNRDQYNLKNQWRLNSNQSRSLIFHRKWCDFRMKFLESYEYAPYSLQTPVPIPRTFETFRQLTHTCRKGFQLERQGKLWSPWRHVPYKTQAQAIRKQELVSRQNTVLASCVCSNAVNLPQELK